MIIGKLTCGEIDQASIVCSSGYSFSCYILYILVLFALNWLCHLIVIHELSICTAFISFQLISKQFLGVCLLFEDGITPCFHFTFYR